MSNHTPKPWTACFSKACGVTTGFHIAAQKHGSTVPVVEAEQRFAPSRRHDEIEANAHLIAAAPEMLEALKEAARLLDQTDMGDSFIQAAIAKAEGRS